MAFRGVALRCRFASETVFSDSKVKELQKEFDLTYHVPCLALGGVFGRLAMAIACCG